MRLKEKDGTQNAVSASVIRCNTISSNAVSQRDQSYAQFLVRGSMYTHLYSEAFKIVIVLVESDSKIHHMNDYPIQEVPHLNSKYLAQVYTVQFTTTLYYYSTPAILISSASYVTFYDTNQSWLHCSRNKTEF